MTESDYNQLYEKTIDNLESRLDEIGPDFDYLTEQGILTLSFDNGTKVIINKQTPLLQLWVASAGGGHHFDYDETSQQWIDDKTKESLIPALNRYVSDQSGEEIKFN